MKRALHTPFFRFLLGLLVAGLLAVPAMADPAADAAARIKDRLAQVDALKVAGQVGEDARGYLAPREPLGPRQQALVDAENADRRVIYASVAERTGQTPDQVGEQRAIQIATRAHAGVWLQRPGGEWFQKP